MKETHDRLKLEILDALEAGRLDDASARLIDLQEARPEDAETWTLTATFFLLEDRTDAAEEALLLAHRLAPDGFEAAFILADLYTRSGRRDEARTYLQRAHAVADPERRVLVEQALAALPAPPRPKLAFLVRAGLDQFLDDLIAQLSPVYEIRKEVVTHLDQVEPVMQWADLCWFEWCDQLLLHATQLEMARRPKIVCRLHRYEVFTDVPARVRWERVDHLIVVADHLVELLRETVPGIAERVAIGVVHNGVDLKRYAFRERRHGHRLAFVGYLHPRKNPTLLLQVIAALVERDPRYELFVAGKFQDALLELYWNHQVKAMGLERHVHFEGWKDDVAAWLEDKDYFLSASIHESFGYAIAEAMAMGIKPVVHNFLFAHDVWPEEILFNTIGEAVRAVADEPYGSSLYRAFIEEHYAQDRQVAQVREILDAVARCAPAGEPAAPMFRPGALQAFVEQVTRRVA